MQYPAKSLFSFSFKSARKLSLFLMLTFTVSFAYAHTDGGVVVKDAWVREAPPVSPVLAGYMTIENHTGKVKELTEVKSSAFQKIEMHITMQKDGMASMEKQDKLPIAAEGKIVLKPGGTHLMLINPVKPVKAGDSVSFVLKFSDGGKSIISVPVKKAASMSSGHHKHGSDHGKDDKKDHGDKNHHNH